jgi:exopolysaccharide/PEP-CTERM locus tyrosine autokinase
MKNTIEKALQKKRDAQLEASNSIEDAVSKQNESKEKFAKADASESKKTETMRSDRELLESKRVPSVRERPAMAKDRFSGAASMTASQVEAAENKYFSIDLSRLENQGMVGLEYARNLINEEYREIKRKLLQNAFGPLASTISNSNIIMVSSARPSEGKTFTAVNLAISIAAEQDKTVLLVDADVLKPNVLKTLDLEENLGLMEYLLGKVDDLSDVIYHTNIPKLRIIPAGQSHHLSTELLASAMMQDTVEEFSTRYPDRVVIIDTPPLIGINESAVLANFAGQAVIVVEENRSKMADIQNAVDRLSPDMAVGFVVNKSTSFSDKGGYYGYQYYGSTEKG